MSPWWGSEMRRWCRAVNSIGMGLSVVALIAAPALAASKTSKATSQEDTLHFVKRVSVGAGGVHIGDKDQVISVGPGGVEVRDNTGETVKVDGDRVRVRDRVTIRGPVVLVDEEGSNIV